MADARPLIEIPVQTVDGRTGKPIADSNTQMFMLPAAPGKCATCATAHNPAEPHNAQSLFYQMRFQLENGRAPDWRDALAHCDPEVIERWTAELGRLGVDVGAGAVNPTRAARTESTASDGVSGRAG